MLDHLGTLVERSLVIAESDEEPRYRLLETTRAFALELLQQAGESDRTQRRHAEAILAVFEASLETRHSLPTQVQMERYLPDLDNVRAALDWAASDAGERSNGDFTGRCKCLDMGLWTPATGGTSSNRISNRQH